MLTPYRYSELGSVNHQLLNEAADRLVADGYHLEIERRPGLFSRFDPNRVKPLEDLADTAGWLLLYGTAEIQEWLATLGQPIVNIGWIDGRLPVCAVYPDARAAGLHAAGLMCSRGYRDLAYLVAKVTSVGDRRAAEAFAEEASRLGARVKVAEHEGTPRSIAKVVCGLMASRPRPTGYLVGCSQAAITVQTCLQHAGLRIPEDAGVISMWNDTYLDFTYPSIARYRTDGRRMGRKAADLLLHQARHGQGRAQNVPFMPQFIEGGSVAPGTARD